MLLKTDKECGSVNINLDLDIERIAICIENKGRSCTHYFRVDEANYMAAYLRKGIEIMTIGIAKKRANQTVIGRI